MTETVEVTTKLKVAKVSTTTLNKQGKNNNTLKTVVPAAVVIALNLQSKDKLEWTINKNSVTVKKHQE